MSVDGGAASAGGSTGILEINIGVPGAQSDLDGRTQTDGIFPPPKTDKPRPHGCGTCGRSFARLEHLKRHERSHTKEKPFQCSECTRCFARRDLLLRHQQKLHVNTTPAARPRSGRRESTSSSIVSGPCKVRKNSVAGGSSGPGGGIIGSMRPRANTISHVDGATLGMIAAANASARIGRPSHAVHARHPSLAGRYSSFGGNRYLQNISTTSTTTANAAAAAAAASYRHQHHLRQSHAGLPHGLSKLATRDLPIDMSCSLHTAPAFQGGFPPDFRIEGMMLSPGNTINPAQLHFSDSPSSLTFDAPSSPFTHGGFGRSGGGIGPRMRTSDNSNNSSDDYPTMDWLHGFGSSMPFVDSNEQAVAGSSPSAISTSSLGGPCEAIIDDPIGNSMPTTGASTSSPWMGTSAGQSASLFAAPGLLSDYTIDFSASSSSGGNGKSSMSRAGIQGGQLSPRTLDFMSDSPSVSMAPASTASSADSHVAPTPAIPNHMSMLQPQQHSPSSSLHPQTSNPAHLFGQFHPPMALRPDTPTTAPSVSSSSHRHSSVTSISTDGLTTDNSRHQSLLSSLSSQSQQSINSKTSGFEQPQQPQQQQRRFSQNTESSMSPPLAGQVALNPKNKFRIAAQTLTQPLAHETVGPGVGLAAGLPAIGDETLECL